MREKVGYIPTLDGWRAIAIAGVVFAHSMNEGLPWIGRDRTLRLADLGGHGVDLFFAISGLLICSRLLDEEHELGHFSLRGFYIRRAFRILPPALLYLLVVGLFAFVGFLTISKFDWVASLLFFRNYTVTLHHDPTRWWFTSHFWTLSVEEHFYLILPGILLLLKRWRLTALGVMILLLEMAKFVLFHWVHVDRSIYQFHSEIRMDALLIPAFLAVWLHRGSHRQQLKRLLPAWSFFLLAPVYLYLLTHYALWPVTAGVAPLLILSTVYHPHVFISRVLESAPLKWIGRLSYSLYLWQQLFVCNRFIVQHKPLGILETPPLNLLLVLACAATSYYFVERPFMRLGHRLAKPITPGHKDLESDSSANTHPLDSTPAASSAPILRQSEP